MTDLIVALDSKGCPVVFAIGIESPSNCRFTSTQDSLKELAACLNALRLHGHAQLLVEVNDLRKGDNQSNAGLIEAALNKIFIGVENQEEETFFCKAERIAEQDIFAVKLWRQEKVSTKCRPEREM